MMINKVYKKLSNPSTKFNDESFKTFTPDFAKRMITLDALDNSITAFKTTFSPDAVKDRKAVLTVPKNYQKEFLFAYAVVWRMDKGEYSFFAKKGEKKRERAIFLNKSIKKYMYILFDAWRSF